MVIPRYLTLNQAASRLNTNLSSLNLMIQSGKIKAVEVAGEIIVSENSVLSTQKKEDLPEYQKFAHLAGQEIWISEAARKYETPRTTVIEWIKKGYIKPAGLEKNRVLVSEQDVAYCAEIYKNRKGQGKWIFNPDGTPYIPKAAQEENASPA